MLNRKQILEKLNKLNLDKNEYIVLSGASLVVQNIINETSDIDLTCSKEYYDKINWNEKIGAFKCNIKYYDCFEISDNLYDSNNIVIIGGYKFMTIDKVLEIKKRLNREKDYKVIEKLENILSKRKEDSNG